MTMRANMGAGVAVLRRDLYLLLSYRFAFVSQWLGLVFTLTLFHFLSRLVRVSAFRSADAYYAFVVVGLVILQMLNSTLQGPPSALRAEMVAGTFERIVLSPFGPVRTLIAEMLFPFFNALVTGVVMLGFASAAFGLPVRWSTAFLVVPLGALGALAFAPFGLAMMALTITVKQANAGTTWIIAAISLISGLYFPIRLLPGWAQWLSYVQPFTPAVDLLRNVLVGTALPDSGAVELAKIVGFTAVLLPASVVAVRLAVSRSQRLGTIIEY